MPVYDIRCKCGYERELMLSSARFYKRISNVLECDKCREIAWKKVPTSANVRFKGDFTPKFYGRTK